MLAEGWLIKELKAEWQPEAVELEFGFGPGRKTEDGTERDPLTLADGIHVNGSIDRVDVFDAPDGTRRIYVRDYKTGSVNLPNERWEDDRVLQAPLYLLAAVELLDGDNQPGGAIYDAVRNRHFSGAVVDGLPGSDRKQITVSDEEMDSLLESARQRAIEAVRGMKEGILRPDPEHCSGGLGECRFPWLCRAGK